MKLFTFFANPLILAAWWLCSPLVLPAQVSVNDSLALVAFYDSLGGPQWINNTNWLCPTEPVSNWYGVTVDNGNVTQIVLKDNGLDGRLPAAITALQHLEKLEIRRNNVTGIESLLGMFALRTLIISENPISHLPLMGDLISLDTLWLYNCQVVTFPDLSNCLALKYLLIMNNGLKHIPSLANNTALTKVIITGNNELTNIPGIEDLVNLEQLTIYGNGLTTLPNINRLQKLWRLDCRANNITVIPPLDSLVSLEYLNVSYMSVSTLPPLHALNKLKTLKCEYTFVDSIPNLGSLDSLETLDIDGARLQHLNGLENCHRLSWLSCELNFLTFLPDLSNAPLTYIRCAYNSLTFEDLDQFTGRTFAYYNFGPQRYFKLQADTVGTSLVLNLPFPCAGCTVAWEHGNTPITSSDSLFIPLGSSMHDNYRCVVSLPGPLFSTMNLVSEPYDPCTGHLDCDLDGDGRCDLNDFYVIASYYGATGLPGSCSTFPPAWGTLLPNGKDVGHLDYNFDGIISYPDSAIVLRDTLYSINVQASLSATTGPALGAIDAQIEEISPGTYKFSATIVPLVPILNAVGVCFGEMIDLPDGFKAIGGLHDLSESVWRDTVDNMLIIMRFYYGGDARLSTGMPSDKARLEVYYSTLNDTTINLYPYEHLSTCRVITIDEQILGSRLSSVYDDTVKMVMQSYGTVFFPGGVTTPLRSHTDTLRYILNPVLDIALALEGTVQEDYVELRIDLPSYTDTKLQILRGLTPNSLAEIGTLEANAERLHVFEDMSPFIGTAYYQVISMGEDGQTGESNIVEISYSPKWKRALLSMAPNPLPSINGRLSLDYLAKSGDKMTIRLVNIQGQIVFQHQTHSADGQNHASLILPTLPKGLYFLSLDWGGPFQEVKRLMVGP